MNKLALLALELIAAKAEKLAYDVEHHRLWPGDLERGLSEITSALNDVRQAARDGDPSDR